MEHDLARVDEHKGVVDRIRRELGGVQCLVNNAGVSSLVRGDLLELKPDGLDRTVGVNLRGTFFFTQAVASAMLDRRR